MFLKLNFLICERKGLNCTHSGVLALNCMTSEGKSHLTPINSKGQIDHLEGMDHVLFVFEEWSKWGGDQTPSPVGRLQTVWFPWPKHLVKNALAYGLGF